jgi:murein DD-endopeptidase MepM/ murein hydrolase activator NlpD
LDENWLNEMLSQSELNPNPKATTVKHGVSFLRQKLAELLPPIWYNNDLDTHHVVHDRIWVLRESRFLFFTRNGPVEITLKPTTVLASAIICMVGVSVIFLSTIFASYSAIEVMRDETIQTAEASIKGVDNHLQRNTDILPSGASDDNLVTWQDDITPHNNASDLPGMIAGKTATAPNPLPSRLNTQPQISAPSFAELSGNTAPIHLPSLPEIINGDNKQDIHQANRPPENSHTKNDKDTKKVNIAKADATGSNLQSDAPIMDLALATTPAQQTPKSNLFTEQIPDQALDQMAGDMITDAPPLTLPESNSAEYASTESENEDSFVRTAAGFAIAMLPRLFSDPEPAPKSEQDKTQPLADNGDDMAAGPLDDGFAITAYSGRTGPMLPSVSDAARAQKMLLSLDGEINYIRKSISQLGIKTDYLPRYDTAKTNTKDTDFKQLLITLAEHRAALRKIPFKTPMLYFYISSEYGHREHPKTGKKSFHHGIDLAGTWQENVRSTAPGTVVFAGREGSFGKVVRIEHDYGISTLYAHLSRITVSVGDYVAENTVIGKMGNTGRSAGSHLHYEIQVDGKSVDPSDFFTIGRQMSVSGELRQTSLTD